MLEAGAHGRWRVERDCICLPKGLKKGKESKDCHLQSVLQKLRSFEGHIFGFHLQEDHMYYSAS